MLSVQNYNTTSFCANRKQNTNDYSGTKIGVGLATIGTASAFAMKPNLNYLTKKTAQMARQVAVSSPELKDVLYKNAENMFNLRRTYKGSRIFKSLAIAIPFYIGCGALVDFANKKQRESLEPNATTQNGNEYTKVNMGKKIGAALGALSYTAMALLNKKQMESMLKASPNKAASIVIATGIAALGGLGLGAWADKLSNKKAAQAADAQA